IAGTAADQGADHFTYDGERPAGWAQADDAWVHGYWSFDWADSYEKILGIDTQQHQIRTAPTGGLLAYTPGHRWYALNLLEELDQPGEWYLDRKTGRLYFWPPSDIAKGRAVVSLATDLIRLDHVSNVTLRGLTLEACRGTAVTITGGAHDLLAGCTLRNIGNRGVVITDGTDDGVQSCDISETGDGGVVLSGGDRKTLTPGRCFVVNCRIHDYSRWDRTYRPGVEVEGVGNRVAHNVIHDAPHEGISLGGNDHVIEYNEVYRVCRETGDVGAFYMGRDWTMRGNVVRFNYFHDLGGGTGLLGDTDANAIYLDDTAAGTTVYGNLCIRAGRGVLVGGGRDNDVENNIFVDCKPAVSLDARGLGWAAKSVAPGGDWGMQEKLAAVPYNQPPYSTRYPHLATVLQDDPAAPKYDVIAHNVMFHCPIGLDVEKAAQPGVTVRDNLLDADPQFVDAAHGNYQLKPTSPAFKLGFQPLPFTQIGLSPDEYRLRR
ncbi:MAG: right-handed parallel beta-helix repeat-containing protein, partial [Armatimonadetes bacterium]|nr:right-handed parallel beta-helix repeat-containing protein [Armatimonadota bacterium]